MPNLTTCKFYLFDDEYHYSGNLSYIITYRRCFFLIINDIIFNLEISPLSSSLCKDNVKIKQFQISQHDNRINFIEILQSKLWCFK